MLGVVDLDTSIMPDVFGLRAFDHREPVVRMLLGEFENMVQVLVPDATATPVGFHDVLLENLSNTPDYRARIALPRDITSLRRRWPSFLFLDMHRRQPDMEIMRRACKREFDSEFGGGRAGACPHCGTQVLCNLSRHIIDYHLELGQLWRCPVEWCSVWKGTAQDCVDHLRGVHNADPSVKLKIC